MWMCTRYGFFSVVTARQDGNRKSAPVDHATMQVRARLRVHLEALRDRFDFLAAFEIIETPHNDYAYRILIPRTVWVEDLMPSLADDVTYENFKSEVGRTWGSKNFGYTHLLHNIWGDGNEMQGRIHGIGMYARRHANATFDPSLGLTDKPKGKSKPKPKKGKTLNTPPTMKPDKPRSAKPDGPPPSEDTPFDDDVTVAIVEPRTDPVYWLITDVETNDILCAVWDADVHDAIMQYEMAANAGTVKVVANPLATACGKDGTKAEALRAEGITVI